MAIWLYNDVDVPTIQSVAKKTAFETSVFTERHLRYRDPVSSRQAA
jgi:hypothetical protein